MEKYASLLEISGGREISGGYDRGGSARQDLDRRYQKIGISAVAAAVRYQGEAKSVSHNRDTRLTATRRA